MKEGGTGHVGIAAVSGMGMVMMGMAMMGMVMMGTTGSVQQDTGRLQRPLDQQQSWKLVIGKLRDKEK